MAAPNRIPIGAPLPEFPAATFNWLVENVLRLNAAQKKTAKPSASLHPRLAVQVENTTSTDIEPGQILGIAGPIFDLDEVPNQVYSAPNVEGVTPDSGDHASRFVVALDFIPQDKVGPALIMGLAWVRVNLTEDESDEHTHCEVVTGETVLQSSSSGIEMIFRGEPDESENEIWALVLLGGGGGGGTTGELTPAIVSSECGGATSETNAELEEVVSPGFGEAEALEAFFPPLATFPKFRVGGGTIVIMNLDPSSSYEVGALVYLSNFVTAGSGPTAVTYAQVISGSCGVHTFPEVEEES